jgi:hypothetical protein
MTETHDSNDFHAIFKKKKKRKKKDDGSGQPTATM